MKLTPKGSDDGYADALGNFLHDVAATRKRLRIYVLAWDFAMLYAFERKWFAGLRDGMANPPAGRVPDGWQHSSAALICAFALA